MKISRHYALDKFSFSNFISMVENSSVEYNLYWDRSKNVAAIEFQLLSVPIRLYSVMDSGLDLKNIRHIDKESYFMLDKPHTVRVNMQPLTDNVLLEKTLLTEVKDSALNHGVYGIAPIQITVDLGEKFQDKKTEWTTLLITELRNAFRQYFGGWTPKDNNPLFNRNCWDGEQYPQLKSPLDNQVLDELLEKVQLKMLS